MLTLLVMILTRMIPRDTIPRVT